MKRLLKFRYRNYKNEEADRRVVVQFADKGSEYGVSPAMSDTVLHYLAPGDQYHPEGGVILTGYCLDRKAMRYFELRRIISQITDEEYTDDAGA